MESRYLIDWFSMTSKTLKVEEWLDMLGLRNLKFEHKHGLHNFAERLYYDGVIINYGGNEAGYESWVELTGQGCRVFESFGNGDWDKLIEFYLSHQEETNLTRLDIAFDDGDTNLLDMDLLCRDALANEFVSKWRKGHVDQELPTETGGRTVYHGSPKSAFLLRIYDKARERGFMDIHWVRVELQMRDERASAFLKAPGTLRERLLGVLQNHLRYIDEDPHDSNRRRWPTKPYWAKFLDGAAKVQLFDKPGVDYNVSKLESYVFGQAGPSIYTYIKCLGWSIFWEQVNELKKHEDRLNPKQKGLIEEWARADKTKAGRIFDEDESKECTADGP